MGDQGLMIQNGFLCNQHGTTFSPGTYHATSKVYGPYYSDSSKATSRVKARICYEMAHLGKTGYPGTGYLESHTIYQNALWYPSEYTGTLGKSVVYSTGTAQIKVNEVTMIGQIGQFKISNLTGTINQITITYKDSEGNEKAETISTGSSNSNSFQFFTDKECNTAIAINKMQQGTYYLKSNDVNNLITKISVNTKVSASGYVGYFRVWSTDSNIQQIVKPEVTLGVDSSATTNVTVDYAYGKIKLQKIGVYIDDENEINEDVTASFKIYCKTLGKWVVGGADEQKTYTNDIEQATVYTSGTTISQLFATYEFEIVEIDVDNPYYNNPINLVKAVSSSQGNLSIVQLSDLNQITSDEGSSNQTISGETTMSVEYGTQDEDEVEESETVGEDENIIPVVKGVIVGNNETNTVTVTDERTAGDLIIKKVDATFNELTLAGAEIKVYCKDTDGWLVQNSDGTYSYDGTAGTATTFTTDEEGKIEIKCVKFGTYAIYETVTPEGYDITRQEGYMADEISSSNGWAFLGEAEVGREDNIVEYEAQNLKIANEITGIVWIDVPHDKLNEIDHMFTGNGDIPKAGVPVELVDSDGNVIATTQTDENGKYSFKYSEKPSAQNEYNLNYWELAHCYVRFIYDNAGEHDDERGEVLNENYGYIVVDPFVGEQSQSSKAQEYTVTQEKLDDNKLTGTEGENRGEAVTYKDGVEDDYNEILDNSAILTAYFNPSNNYTIEDINLGLAEKNDPKYSVNETLDYVKVTMNGYEYTYNYGDSASPEDSTLVGSPKVSKQNSVKTFAVSVYPSDVAYNKVNEKDELKVYVVYKISVTNDEMTSLDYVYNEQKLYLESLENRFDANRYELCTETEIVDDKDKASQIANWSYSDSGVLETDDDGEVEYIVASYDLNDDNNAFKEGIEKNNNQGDSNNTKSTYIQYRIRNDALTAMLSGNLTYDIIEKYPSISYARAYHEYLRTDNIWDQDPSVRSYTGDSETNGTNTSYDSESGDKKYFVHKSIVKERDSGEFYIKLSLNETSRKILGTVFEDSFVDGEDSNTNLGNGIYDENENIVEAVQVDIIAEATEDADPIKLYQVKDNNIYYVQNEQGEKELPNASCETYKDGSYSFEGVVPGYYYIRFTYSNGKQNIYDKDGNMVIVDVTSRDYKSTIITSDVIYNAIESPDETTTSWYKNLDQAYSTAVDDLKVREGISDEYEINGSLGYITMPAYTPETGISIEYDKEDDETDGGDKHIPEFKGFNFGIIKVPDTKTSLYKETTNVTLKSQLGNDVLSANPAAKTSPVTTADRTESVYLSDLSDINVLNASGIGGSNYAKLEIDPSYIQGANFEVTYTIKVKNESDIDYDNVEYYKYGTNTENPTTIIVEVLDKLDDRFEDFDLQEIEYTSTVERTSGTETGNITITRNPDKETITNPDGSITETSYQALEITKWAALETGESQQVTYKATAQLSSDDDTSFSNAAQIVNLEFGITGNNDSLATLQKNYVWSENNAVVTITPSTGADRTNTYWVVGAIALVVLATGIVILKKKVLK